VHAVCVALRGLGRGSDPLGNQAYVVCYGRHSSCARGYGVRGILLEMESPMDITELLAAGVRRRASDLHLSAGLAPMLRVDGEVWPLDWPVLEPTQIAELLSPLLNNHQQKDFETSLETDFAFELPEVARFRVNVFQQHRGMGAVFRTIPSTVQSLESLGWYWSPGRPVPASPRPWRR
jgi:hypothetical protein